MLSFLLESMGLWLAAPRNSTFPSSRTRTGPAGTCEFTRAVFLSLLGSGLSTLMMKVPSPSIDPSSMLILATYDTFLLPPLIAPGAYDGSQPFDPSSSLPPPTIV